jgi:hypothetical protein
MTAAPVPPARAAEGSGGIPGFVLEDLKHTVMNRYETLCQYLGWRPRPEWIEDLAAELAAGRLTYGDVLGALADSDAFDLYPNAPTAHRYLFRLAVLMGLMCRCPASGDIPDWLCDERLAAAVGWFFIARSAAPIYLAIDEVAPE